jgi:hypothetical protein
MTLTETKSSESPELAPCTVINTTARLDIDENQIISYGIAQKERALEDAITAADAEVTPLIRQSQQLQEEVTQALPKAAERAGKPYEAPLREAFAPLKLKVRFEVTGYHITDEGKGEAIFSVRDDAHSYNHLDSTISFDLPQDIADKRAALKTLSAQIGAARAYQVKLKQQLTNLPREERAMRGALAKHIIGQSPEGKQLLEVMEASMLPLPARPDLLALGAPGAPVASTSSKGSAAKSARRRR